MGGKRTCITMGNNYSGFYSGKPKQKSSAWMYVGAILGALTIIIGFYFWLGIKGIVGIAIIGMLIVAAFEYLQKNKPEVILKETRQIIREIIILIVFFVLTMVWKNHQAKHAEQPPHKVVVFVYPG